MMAWVTDSPNSVNDRSTSLEYRFLSAMQGGLGIGANLNKWTPEDFQIAKKMVAQYKQIRETAQDGALYRLISPLGGFMFGIDWDRLTSGNAKRLPIKDTGAQRLYVHTGISASQGYLSAQIWRRQKHPFPIHPRCNCSLKAENRQQATESSGAIHEHTCDRIVHFQ